MNRGIEIGDAAISILGDHGGTLAEAAAQLEHLAGTKADLMEAVAYAACQVGAYRRMSNQDAALALGQVRTVLDQFEAREKAKRDDLIRG